MPTYNVGIFSGKLITSSIIAPLSVKYKCMRTTRFGSLFALALILTQVAIGLFNPNPTASAEQDLTAIKQYSYYAAFRSCIAQGRLAVNVTGGTETRPENGLMQDKLGTTSDAPWAYLGFLAPDASTGRHDGGVWCRDMPALVVNNLGISVDELMQGLGYQLNAGTWRTTIVSTYGGLQTGPARAKWDDLAKSKQIATTEEAYFQYYFTAAALTAPNKSPAGGCEAQKIDNPSTAEKSSADAQTNNYAWATLVTDDSGATTRSVFKFPNLNKDDVSAYPKPNDATQDAGRTTCKKVVAALTANSPTVASYVNYLKTRTAETKKAAVKAAALQYCQSLSSAAPSSPEVRDCAATVADAQEKCWQQIRVTGGGPDDLRNRTDAEKADCLIAAGVRGTDAQLLTLITGIDTAINSIPKPGSIDASGVTATTAGQKPTCSIDTIGWIVCPVVRFLGNVADGASDTLNNMLAVQATKLFDTSKPQDTPYGAWQQMRNYANILFVIVFLFIIFSQVTSIGISNYGIKKLLPKMVVVAILVNISFYVCALAVDLSNLLGYNLSILLDGAIKLGDPNTSTDLAAQGNGFTTIIAAALVVGATGLVAYFALAAITGIVISAVAIGITMVVLLGIRQGLILLLVVASPIAFVSMLLPNTEGLFKKWRKMFQSMLLIFPIAGLLYGAGKMAGKVLIISDGHGLVGALGEAMPIIMLVATYRVFTSAMNGIAGVGEFANGMRRGLNRAGDPLRALARSSDALNRSRFMAGNVAGLRRLGNFATRRRAGYDARLKANRSEAEANAAEHVEHTQQRFTDRSKVAGERKTNAETAADNAANRNLLTNRPDVLARSGQLREQKRDMDNQLETHKINSSIAQRSAADISEKTKTNAEQAAKNQSLNNLQTFHPNLIREEGDLKENQRRLDSIGKRMQVAQTAASGTFEAANRAEMDVKEAEGTREATWKQTVATDTPLTEQMVRIEGQQMRGQAADEQVKSATKDAVRDGTMLIDDGAGGTVSLQDIRHDTQDAKAATESSEARIEAQDTERELTDAGLQASRDETLTAETETKRNKAQMDAQDKELLATDAYLQGVREQTHDAEAVAKVHETDIKAQDAEHAAGDPLQQAARQQVLRNEADTTASEAAIKEQDTAFTGNDAAIQASRLETQKREAGTKLAETEIKRQDASVANTDSYIVDAREETLRAQSELKAEEATTEAQDSDFTATDAAIQTSRAAAQDQEAVTNRAKAEIDSQDKQRLASDPGLKTLREGEQIAKAEASAAQAEISAQDAEFAVNDPTNTMQNLGNETRAQQNRANEATRQQSTNYRQAILSDPTLRTTAGGTINPIEGQQRAEAAAMAEVNRARTEEVNNARLRFADDSNNDKIVGLATGTTATSEIEREAAILHIMEKGSHGDKLSVLQSLATSATSPEQTTRSLAADLYAKSGLSDLFGKSLAGDLREGQRIIRDSAGNEMGREDINLNSVLINNLKDIQAETVASNSNYASSLAGAYQELVAKGDQNAIATAQSQLKSMFATINTTAEIRGKLTSASKRALNQIASSMKVPLFGDSENGITPGTVRESATMTESGLWEPSSGYKPGDDGK